MPGGEVLGKVRPDLDPLACVDPALPDGLGVLQHVPLVLGALPGRHVDAGREGGRGGHPAAEGEDVRLGLLLVAGVVVLDGLVSGLQGLKKEEKQLHQHHDYVRRMCIFNRGWTARSTIGSPTLYGTRCTERTIWTFSTPNTTAALIPPPGVTHVKMSIVDLHGISFGFCYNL